MATFVEFNVQVIYMSTCNIANNLTKRKNNMKNKLLLTTAIAGLVAVGGVAQAETKVSGNLEQVFRATSDDANNGRASTRGLGGEYNIGLSSSAELDNGLTAKFGFNLEANGGGANPDVHFLTIGNDTMSVSIARDNGNNLSSTGIPHISDTASTVVGGAYHNLGIDSTDGHNDDHIRADINAVGGTVTLRYVPTDGGAGVSQYTSSGAAPAEAENSSYDILYRGSLGVEGLTVVAGTHRKDGTGTAVDTKLEKYSVAYNFGQFAAGVELQKSEMPHTTATQVTEYDSKSASITFAVNDKLSVGYARSETELTTNGTKNANEEKINMFGIGYSLGGIAIDVNYAQTDNWNNGSTDRDNLQIRTIQKF